jgi:ABC-2 type transport system permease protein
MTSSTSTAKLYDIRYSRYGGSREARWRSVLALARSSATRAVGLRRTTGAKVWPFLLITAAHLPVVAALGIPLLFDAAPEPLDLLSYGQILVTITAVMVAFAATTLPSLLTRERRDRVLSLYFSTAVSPWEYLAAKVLAAVALMSSVTLSPLLILLVGSVLTDDKPVDQLRDTGGDVLGVLAAGCAVALYFGALGLLAGSLTSKRIFAVGGLLAVLLVTPVIGNLVAELADRPAARAADLTTLPLRAADTLLAGRTFEEPARERPSDVLVWSVWAGTVLLSAAVLVVRYRRSDDA